MYVSADKSEFLVSMEQENGIDYPGCQGHQAI